MRIEGKRTTSRKPATAFRTAFHREKIKNAGGTCRQRRLYLHVELETVVMDLASSHQSLSILTFFGEVGW